MCDLNCFLNHHWLYKWNEERAAKNGSPVLCPVQVFSKRGGGPRAPAPKVVRTGFCLAPKQVDSCCCDLVSQSVYSIPKGWITLAWCQFTLAVCYWALFIFLLKLPLPEISVIPWTLLPASAGSWPPRFDKQCLLVTFKASLGVSSWPGICLPVSHRWVERGGAYTKALVLFFCLSLCSTVVITLPWLLSAGSLCVCWRMNKQVKSSNFIFFKKTFHVCYKLKYKNIYRFKNQNNKLTCI